LSETLSQGVFQLLSLVVAAAIMLQLDPLLGGIVLLGAPLVAVVYRAMGGGAYKRSLAVQEQSSQLLSITGENYAAEPVVKMFSLGGRERERFARSAERLFRRQLSLMLYGGIFGLSVNMIVTFLRLFVLGFGSWLILEGRFTIGGLVAFLGIMGEVISPVTVLTNIGQELQASTGALVRINAILDSEPEVDDPPDGVELPRLSGEIRLAGVGFSYDGTNRTLDGLDLTISAGSKVAFVGPSGSGKSTVLRLLMRLYDPDEGAVLFDGVDLRQASMSSHRDQLGVVFQESFLFSTTVRENIALGRPGASEAEVREAAIQAEVDDFIERLPRSYDTLVGERGALLSGGQRQRVSIARALIRDPAVLLLDEATSALDPRTERQINDTLDRVGAGRTTISVTHRLTSVVDYDRIFVLVDGTLAEQGNHDELVAAGGVYAHLWSEQTGESVVEAPEFGSADMLRRVPIFADLDADGLEWVARRLRVSSVPAGTVVPEEGGRLVFVAGGRAEVHAPGLRGGDTKLAGLGPGDVFGLSALLGHDRDAELRVVVDSQLAVLADTDVRATADRYAVVAEALRGVRPATAGPVGGRRLSRSTFVGKVPDDRWREPQTALARTAEVEREVRRASGVYERLTP
jgi:ABC-type multidrug transport system fused ATPase/permease subunit